jgi:hypothetical protein
MDPTRADRLARLVLSVRDELRDLLIARDGQTVHRTAMEATIP